MSADRLNIRVGTALTLEAKGENACYFVNLIGYLNGASLLVTVPPEADGCHLKVGDEVLVRYIHDGMIVGFSSHLLHSSAEPYPYWHLSYPRGVQGRMLRRAVRIPYAAPAMTSNQSEAVQPVVMTDLSLSGARLKVREPIGHVGEAFVLELTNPQGQGLRIPCHIRHVLTQPNGRAEVGVEFDDLPLEAHHQIESLIRHSMAAGHTARG